MDKWNIHVEKWKKLAQERGIEVEFPYWGESEILNRLCRETHAGRLYFWFNAEYLHKQWFEQHIEVTKANVGPRYSPELSVDLPIARLFDGLGRVPDFVPRKLKSSGRQLARAWQVANRIEWREYASSEFSLLERSVQELITMIAELEDIGVLQLPLARLHELVLRARQILSDCIHQLDIAARVAQEEEKHARSEDTVVGRHITKSENLRSGGYCVARMANELDLLLEFTESAEAKLANIPALLLVGDAGTGKTHLFCDIAEQRISGDQENYENDGFGIIEINVNR